MLEHSHHYFNQAADILALDSKMREILLRPNRVVKVAIVDEDDDGTGGGTFAVVVANTSALNT